jgi:hypothetical protein
MPDIAGDCFAASLLAQTLLLALTDYGESLREAKRRNNTVDGITDRT